MTERVHPDDRHAFDAAWTKIGEASADAPFEFRLKGADGAYRRVSCSARRASQRGEIHGSLRELPTARVVPEDGDAETQVSILHAVEDSLPIGVWMIDRQGIFIHHRGNALSRVRRRQREFVGRNVFELLQSYPGVLDAIRRALAGEVMHMLDDSSSLPFESWHIPVRDAAGEVISVVGVALEIPERWKAEQELQEKLLLVDRQQQVIRVLSTPIIEVWDKVLTLPLVGVMDSTRAAEVMENLLLRVREKGAQFAILDLTGVEAVDTSTASHLLKLIQALRLLGAEGIITGIRPTVAQTIITLGVDLGTITTLGSLRDALRFCIKRMRAPVSASPLAAPARSRTA